MTPVSVLIPIRVQCVLLVVCVLAAIVGVGLTSLAAVRQLLSPDSVSPEPPAEQLPRTTYA